MGADRLRDDPTEAFVRALERTHLDDPTDLDGALVSSELDQSNDMLEAAPNPARGSQRPHSIRDLMPSIADEVLPAMFAGDTTSSWMDVDLNSAGEDDRVVLTTRGAKVLLTYLPDTPLRESVPALGHLAGTIPLIDLSRRSGNALSRKNVRTWPDLAGQSPTQLGQIRNLGHKSVVEIVAFAIFTATRPGFQVDFEPPAGSASDGEAAVRSDWDVAPIETMEALGVIRAWGVEELGQPDFKDVLITALRPDQDLPAEVADAVTRLIEVDLESFTMGVRDRFDVAGAIHATISQLDDRQARIFGGRTLSLERPRTLESFAQDLGLTRERVRQIEAKANRKVEAELARPAKAVVGRTARRLRGHLGIAFPVDVLTPAHPAGAILDDPTLGADRARLLLLVAGPYKLQDGWLLLGALPSEATAALLDELESDGMDESGAIERLVSRGFVPAAADAWLRRHPNIRIADGRVNAWHSRMADRAEVLLREHGSPMTLKDLSVSIPDRSPRSLGNALLADARFKRTGIRHYGLANWDHPEYTSIAEEIEQAIDEQGGEVGLEDLIRQQVSQFGVSAASVRSIANGGRFQTAGGIVRLRNGSPRDPDAMARAIEFTPSCFRMDGGWAWAVVVDEHLLRGSGRHIAPGFAYEIGLVPNESMTAPWPYGTLTIAWPGLQPAISSIRAGLGTAGATVGDTVFIQYVEADATFAFHHVPFGHLESSPAWERLHLATGGNGRSMEPSTRDLARSLGFSDHPTASVVALHRRLRARREAHLMDLLEEAEAGSQRPEPTRRTKS